METELTIPRLLASTVARVGDAPALGTIDQGKLSWQSWPEVVADASRLAAAIRAAGVEPGDRVAHISENRTEWIVTDLALHLARAVHVPIHATLPAAIIAEQIADSGARLALVSRHSLLLSLRECAPPTVRYVSYEQGAEGLGQFVANVCEEVIASVLPRAVHETQPDELATILYTSGTTGRPRGVMLSQRNLASNATATASALDGRPSDIQLNFLPLSHIYARTCDLYCWLAVGSRLAVTESRDTTLRDLGLVQPHLINGVPYFYQKIYDRVRSSGTADARGALRSLWGDNMRLCCSGGAALAPDVERWFADSGLPILPGYGLTEASPVVAASTPQARRLGTVGRPLPGVEVKTAEDGELLVRGPGVMLGYWQDPEATANVIRDGWLCTGDLVHIDAEGFVTIRGRKKELIVLSTGKNVAPTRVEGLLAASPLIEQVAVVGDGRSHLGAVIVPGAEALNEALRKQRIFVWSARHALRHRRVRALYAAEIAQRLRDAAPEEQVHAFCLIDRGFSIERGELTPKLSLCRETILCHFEREIEAMYARRETPVAADAHAARL